MRPAVDSGIVTSDALVSYGLLWPMCFLLNTVLDVPWVPEVFLAYGGNFRCWPKADTSLSGTQGILDVFAKLNSPQFPRLSFFTAVD